MGRGGYRASNPGGRPKGVKDSKPRKGTEAQIEAGKIRQMLALGTKAKAKFFQEFLIRVSKNEKLTLAEKNMMDKLAVELAAELEGETPVGKLRNLTPLEYMLNVMNDPNEKDSVRKDRMAIAASPYCHPRKGEAGTGKKDEQGDRAATAAKGKFKAGRAPLALVQ